MDNPQLPIAVTEGAKKAGCLMSHGYISICLTGVWNSKQKKKLKAIPTLAPFLVQGRLIKSDRVNVSVFPEDRLVLSVLKTQGYRISIILTMVRFTRVVCIYVY